MGSMLTSFDISARGLSIQRAKMDVTAQNLANAETTETPEGGPYRRKRVLVKEEPFKTSLDNALKRPDTILTKTNSAHRSGHVLRTGDKIELSSAEATEVRDPASSYRLVYDPSHPQADEEGFVKMPDIEIINEMVDMMSASRAYEANTVAISTTKKMAKDALDI
ncbi:flagellar basal body rod protein FlgC [bacterium]|nr:flagellar basal body rod protein FlgC [bacterium]MCB2201565.1 flagellar basal body rod protein FlgC [bacterium]